MLNVHVYDIMSVIVKKCQMSVFGRAKNMMQELTAFLSELNHYVQSYPGAVKDAFHFQEAKNSRFLINSCPAQLLRRKKKGSYLFHIYQPLDYVYILLEGNCCVEKYKQSGAVVTDNTRYPLQMFGLFEGLAGIQYYSTTMRCVSDCVYIQTPIESYMYLLRSDPKLMWMTMQFLSSFLADYIDSSDLLILSDPRYIILSKLYRYCLGKTFPVTVHYKKEDLARDLNLNLRTMYRYLDQYYKSGLLSSKKGKIMITQEQHKAIGEFLEAE